MPGSLVGRTGAPPVTVALPDGSVVVVVVLSEEPGGRTQRRELAHTLSVWQHPPPNDAGQGLLSGRQVAVEAVRVVVLVVDDGSGAGITVTGLLVVQLEVLKTIVVEDEVGVMTTVVITLITPAAMLVRTGPIIHDYLQPTPAQT